MANENVSIRFYLNTRTVKAGKHPVYLRITVNRKKAEVVTDHYLLKSEWNDEKQRAKKNFQINDGLSEIEKQINDIVYSLRREKKTYTPNLIKRIYTKDDSIDHSLLSYFAEHISRLNESGELAKSTITRYSDTLDHLEKYLISKNQKEFLLTQVDYKFISDFDIYLLNQSTNRVAGKLTRNTVNKHHVRLKTVLIRAQKEGIISKLPYTGFKVKNTPSQRTFLNQEELDKLIQYSFSHNKTLDKAKDIFIFSVYTGLRFQDAQNLKITSIIRDKKGEHYIDSTQSKTQEQITIPLLKPALEIIAKYDNDERKITKCVLPKISNQKLNIYLKEIANIVGIEKEFSHHVARHTCATMVLLKNSVPMEIVSKWLGHNSIRTTQIYAKITKESMQDHANKINNTFKNAL